MPVLQDQLQPTKEVPPYLVEEEDQGLVEVVDLVEGEDPPFLAREEEGEGPPFQAREEEEEDLQFQAEVVVEVDPPFQEEEVEEVVVVDL